MECSIDNTRGYNILIPTSKSVNLFFEEIITESNNNFFYGSLETSIINIDAVLIHWPEELFGWKKPNHEQIQYLENTIIYWKSEGLKLFYLVNNERPHASFHTKYKKLYNIILNKADVFIHMGKFSQQKYESNFPNSKHEIIFHPTYNKSYKIYNKDYARKLLGFCEEKLIVLVPGQIRSLKEEKNTIAAFTSLKQKNKLLIIPRMYYRRVHLEFKGRILLKRIIDINKVIEKIINFRILRKDILLEQSFLNSRDLSLYMSACNLIYLPRENNLNSGMVFLAATFKKLAVGPNVGNIEEHLKNLNFIGYKAQDSKSRFIAINKAASLINNKHWEITNVKMYSPKNLAIQWDNLCAKYLNKN